MNKGTPADPLREALRRLSDWGKILQSDPTESDKPAERYDLGEVDADCYVSAYRVWAKGGRFTRGLYEAKNLTPADFEIWAADGDTLEPLYTAETQRSLSGARPDERAISDAAI